MQRKINCQSSLTSTMEQKKGQEEMWWCFIVIFHPLFSVHPFRVLLIKELLTLLFFHIPLGFNMLKITKSFGGLNSSSVTSSPKASMDSSDSSSSKPKESSSLSALKASSLSSPKKSSSLPLKIRKKIVKKDFFLHSAP